jgi:nanoRNase/pAp phosphatase (c-di-AMP/oligoRNAs hydrolase)
MPREQPSRRVSRRSDRLLALLSEREQVLVVAHDNPDPDAIATGWAVQHLIRRKLDKPVRVVAGGGIVRAENRHMLKLLEPPIELVHELDVPDETAVVLVDCGFRSGNHILSEDQVRPVAVIDHHLPPGRRARLRFQDLRPNVAASASIAASYLREQDIEPGPKLATALLYAIRTETQAYETHHSRLDRSIIAWLTPRADPTQLAEIQSAPLSRVYFGDLALALGTTFVYDNAAICLLPRANGPEIVGEVADLLIRCESVERVLCGAVIGNDFLVSVRTQAPSESAADFVRAALAGLGRGGGHAHRAGGRIAEAANEGKIPESLQDRLRQQWLEACGVDRQRGTRLIPKREVIDNL